MNKHDYINDYLAGKHPVEQEQWKLPTADELDRDEVLFDQLLAERKKKSPLRKNRIMLLSMAAAAAVTAVVVLFNWNEDLPQTQFQRVPIVTANAPKEDAPCDTVRLSVPKLSTRRVVVADEARQNGRRKATLPSPDAKSQQESDTPVLANAADSLYYYLTLLEKQVGNCQDSSCIAEMTRLMRDDERIKCLVDKIVNKQVENPYKEEYLVDSITRYIPI